MKNISLSIKITTVFVFVSIMSVMFFYVMFSSLFEEYMLNTEQEKVELIAETIEPSIAMNSYLGLNDEIENLVKRISNRKHILGVTIMLNKKIQWEKKYNESKDHFHVDYPVKDPISNNRIGNIRLAYSKQKFNNAVNKMRQRVLVYLAFMSVFFLTFVLLIRYLLHPLNKIAQRVKSYKLGDNLNFKEIRMEPETEAISEAFTLMMDNVREYTVLLEQYKLSVDESSIVSKLSPEGKITYANDEFVRVCGYSKQQLLGSDINLMNHPEMNVDILDEINQAMTTKTIWKGVLRNLTESGDDYYVKSTIVPLLDEDSELLEFISIQHDITQLIEQGEQILRQSTDQNTGLPNRVKLSEDIKLNNNSIFALFSLDNYEIIKNYYGYDTAYKSLKKLSEMLQKLLAPQKISLYKLAGGEFGFLAEEEMDIDWFEQICRFVIEKTEEYHINIDEDSIDLRASIGFTSNKENYLSYSGLALRHAIEIRKSLIYYEDQENLIAQYENNLNWTKKIKSALADDRITLFAQPLVDSKSMKTKKYECLVRLIDENGKLVSPYFFLDVAKKTKLYHQITKKVISISFEVFSQLPDKQFGINLSAEDILHNETVEYLEGKIIEYDIGNRLILEIVESEGIESFKEVTDFLNKMKALGCQIAIDDFGTGYSNFSYLTQLKVDHIKIDGSLIKDIDKNPNSQVICKTILNFSSALNMTTVAEFVHNESVMNYVKELGFDYLQGYHLGEPETIYNLLNKTN